MRWKEEEISRLQVGLSIGNSYEELSLLLGRTKSSLMNKAQELGFRYTPVVKETCRCKECGVTFEAYIIEKRVFCSSKCAASFNNRTTPKRVKREKPLKETETKKKKSYKRYTPCKHCGIKEGMEKYKSVCEACRVEYYKFYRPSAEFDFDINLYPHKFDLSIVKEMGWYSPSNKGNNLLGISRDHLYSVNDGFKNKIPVDIIKHPANCKLILHIDNQKKRTNSTITLEELKQRILEW